jgi:DNA-binding winged helix-turn-helix (wHTH) protein/tetratricopeptide (TPR) repeat protein
VKSAVAVRASRAFAFGPFRLVPERQLLLRGEQAVRIGGRALDLLTALVERPGDLVSKSELLAQVWPDTNVDESNLKVNVAALRRVLEKGPDTPQYIATIIGRGYRFVAPVQVVGPVDLSVEANAPSAPNHNLPLSTTRIVGRANAIAGIRRDLDQSRLVSIVGEGGIGKSTVAIAVAEAAIEAFGEGVWHVDLSTLKDADRTAHAIAAAVGLQADAPDMLAALCAFLRSRQTLLVLDNCEHVIDGVASCADRILTSAAGVRILATGREPLEIANERVRRLSALDTTSAQPEREVHRLVGRIEELGVLQQAVESALAGGTGLVIVEGEPGVGKSRLLEEASAEGGRRGALVVWGRCLEGEGTPSMWPWVQAIGAVLDGLPAAAREEWYAGDLGRLVGPRGGVPSGAPLPDSGAQFRLFEHAVALVGQVSVRRPVVLVIDDLQWADAASLDLFSHLAARLPARAMIIGALRDRAPTPGSELSRMLAAASRLPRHRRIRLGPLGPTEVAELVRREIGQDPGPGIVHSVHARTAGNPFFVRELARLLADGGGVEDAAARTGVPSTVRDIVRDRMAGMDEDTKGLLQIAALIGRDVDVALLARTADLDVQTCLRRLEPVEGLGLLEHSHGNPYSFRFAHDLVRESVAGATPARAARLHLLVADELSRRHGEDESVAERLAHHLWSAGPLADPARTAATLIRAGRCAAGKSALATAARQLNLAARVARTAGLAELELSALSLVTAVDGMQGYHGSALELLERAEQLACDLGREREAADFLFSRWLANAQDMRLDRSHPLARRLLERGEASTDPILQTYGHYAWAIHQWEIGNIGESFRYLSRTSSTLKDALAHGKEKQLRRDLWLLGPVMLALMTALHGDVDTARALLATIEAATSDDPYVITVWAAFAVVVAAVAGDPASALRAAERGIAADPEFSFVYLGAHQRLGRCWARAVTGEDPASAAAEADGIIAMAMATPPRSGLAMWTGLLGEMWRVAGNLDESAAALDRADAFLETYGERYAEGLLLLLRARLMLARGEPIANVRATAERARVLSVEREAHLFARRAEDLLATLPVA